MKNKIEKPQQADDSKMALSSKNYKLMLIGAIVILIGFILMTGGGSDAPTDFDPGMFSFRRITLAPILVIGGFVFEVYAIMKNFKE